MRGWFTTPWTFRASGKRRGNPFRNVRKGPVLFCASGRLVRQKGFDRLVTACRYLAQEGFSFHLWILGEGPERKTLERMIAEGNLQGRISLLGQLENPYPYVKAADWLVCSSRSEGYSTVISESLILARPWRPRCVPESGSSLGTGNSG